MKGTTVLMCWLWYFCFLLHNTEVSPLLSSLPFSPNLFAAEWELPFCLKMFWLFLCKPLISQLHDIIWRIIWSNTRMYSCLNLLCLPKQVSLNFLHSWLFFFTWCCSFLPALSFWFFTSPEEADASSGFHLGEPIFFFSSVSSPGCVISSDCWSSFPETLKPPLCYRPSVFHKTQMSVPTGSSL